MTNYSRLITEIKSELLLENYASLTKIEALRETVGLVTLL